MRTEHSVPAYTGLVRRFADSVAARGSVTLVGTSMGGHVAALAALADPEAVHSVVLVGPVGLRPLGKDARRSIAASIVDTSVEGIRRSSASCSSAEHGHVRMGDPGASDQQLPRCRQALGAIARYFAQDIENDILTADQLRFLVETVPTMFVWGADDRVVPPSIADDVEHSLGVSVTRIRSAGHVPLSGSARRLQRRRPRLPVKRGPDRQARWARMRERRAEIVGAGLAGLLAACALAQRDWKVRVHERSRELRMFRAGIWLWENGLTALQAIGALDEAIARGQQISAWEIRDRHGHLIRRRPALPWDRLIVPPRADMYEALKRVARDDGVEVVTGSKAISADPSGEVVLADGSRLTADLVVAADGLRSAIRESLRLTKSFRPLGNGAIGCSPPPKGRDVDIATEH